MKSPDNIALLSVLRDVAELCRRLELSTETATFEAYIVRFQKEKPTFEILQEDVRETLQRAALPILSKLKGSYQEFNQIQTTFGEVCFPGLQKKHEQMEQNKKERSRRKAIRDSGTFWQLDGESDLHAITIPDRPKANALTTVRLTHSNSYGPFDQADFFVRVGSPSKPTAQDDLDSVRDWVRAELVEELVTIDDEEMLRSEAHEPFEDETPWEGTYDAQLTFHPGQHSIEIKIISQHPELLRSLVLSGLEVEVR